MSKESLEGHGHLDAQVPQETLWDLAGLAMVLDTPADELVARALAEFITRTTSSPDFAERQNELFDRLEAGAHAPPANPDVNAAIDQAPNVVRLRPKHVRWPGPDSSA